MLSLNTSKAAGIDQISAKYPKDVTEVSALPLRNIINFSIKVSTVPASCKIVKTYKLKPAKWWLNGNYWFVSE